MALEQTSVSELPVGLEATPRRASRLSWTGAVRRVGLAGPLLLVTLQGVVNYLRLELPSGLVARHPGDPGAYHRFLAAHLAYSDLYTLFWHHHLYRHPIPYVDVRIEYPVVMGLYMAAAAALTAGVRAYFFLSSLGLYACALGTVWALWGISRRAAWAFSLSPLLIVFSFLNWDLLGIFFMLAGWRAFSRERYLLAALLLSLGTFTKAYPAFLLVFCLAALIRRWRDGGIGLGAVGSFLGTAVLTGAVANIPFIVVDERRWAYFFVLNRDRNQRVSVLYWWHILSRHSSRAFSNDLLTALVVALVAAGLYFVWRRADPAKVTAIAFGLFLALQKVYSPQYLLWLLAFAVIAEWDGWALAAISVLGLVDYTSAAMSIYFELHSPAVAHWYARRVKPLGRDLRLSLLLSTAGAAAGKRLTGRRRSRAVLEPAR